MAGRLWEVESKCAHNVTDETMSRTLFSSRSHSTPNYTYVLEASLWPLYPFPHISQVNSLFPENKKADLG